MTTTISIAKISYSYAKSSKASPTNRTTYMYKLELDASGSITPESLQANVEQFISDEAEEAAKNKVPVAIAYLECTTAVNKQFVSAVTAKKPSKPKQRLVARPS